MGSTNGAAFLAERLGVDEAAARCRLDAFSVAMAAELFASGIIAVDGLGSFSVVHDRASRDRSNGSERFLPPVRRLSFDPAVPSKGGIERIAAGRMGMAPAEAAAFARLLAGALADTRAGRMDLEFRGFGRFSAVGDEYRFEADKSLEETLNSAFSGLSTLEIGAPASAERPRPQMGPVIGGALFLLFAALGLYAWGSGSLDGIVSRALASRPGTDPSLTGPAGESGKAVRSADSLVIPDGGYTVVVSTFSTRRVALSERQRLAALGHKLAIWPVSKDGRQYYRLVAGSFTSRRAAADSIMTMPPGLPRGLYIQQASKHLILYGEQGVQ